MWIEPQNWPHLVVRGLGFCNSVSASQWLQVAQDWWWGPAEPYLSDVQSSCSHIVAKRKLTCFHCAGRISEHLLSVAGRHWNPLERWENISNKKLCLGWLEWSLAWRWRWLYTAWSLFEDVKCFNKVYYCEKTLSLITESKAKCCVLFLRFLLTSLSLHSLYKNLSSLTTKDQQEELRKQSHLILHRK